MSEFKNICKSIIEHPESFLVSFIDKLVASKEVARDVLNRRGNTE